MNIEIEIDDIKTVSKSHGNRYIAKEQEGPASEAMTTYIQENFERLKKMSSAKDRMFDLCNKFNKWSVENQCKYQGPVSFKFLYSFFKKFPELKGLYDKLKQSSENGKNSGSSKTKSKIESKAKKRLHMINMGIEFGNQKTIEIMSEFIEDTTEMVTKIISNEKIDATSLKIYMHSLAWYKNESQRMRLWALRFSREHVLKDDAMWKNFESIWVKQSMDSDSTLSEIIGSETSSGINQGNDSKDKDQNSDDEDSNSSSFASD